MAGKTSRRGFASMSLAKRRDIASRGGKAAHARGTAHEWDKKEAQAAGRRGGLARQRQQRDTDNMDLR